MEPKEAWGCTIGPTMGRYGALGGMGTLLDSPRGGGNPALRGVGPKDGAPRGSPKRHPSKELRQGPRRNMGLKDEPL